LVATQLKTHRGQLLDFFVGGTQRGQSNLLRELGEAGIGQQGHVTQQLVNGVAVMTENNAC